MDLETKEINIDFVEIDFLMAVFKAEPVRKRYPGIPTILIIDDSKIQLKRLEKMLVQLGYNDILMASNGGDALKIVQKRMDIDLIISDCEMPMLDGFQLLKTLKADANFNSIPFLMTSQKADKALVVKALRGGARDFLVQPFGVDVLGEKVKKHAINHDDDPGIAEAEEEARKAREQEAREKARKSENTDKENDS